MNIVQPDCAIMVFLLDKVHVYIFDWTGVAGPSLLGNVDLLEGATSELQRLVALTYADGEDWAEGVQGVHDGSFGFGGAS